MFAEHGVEVDDVEVAAGSPTVAGVLVLPTDAVRSRAKQSRRFGTQSGIEDPVHFGVAFAEVNLAAQYGESQAVGTPPGQGVMYAQSRSRVAGSGKRKATSLTNTPTEVGELHRAQSRSDGRQGVSPSA